MIKLSNREIARNTMCSTFGVFLESPTTNFSLHTIVVPCYMRFDLRIIGDDRQVVMTTFGVFN